MTRVLAFAAGIVTGVVIALSFVSQRGVPEYEPFAEPWGDL